MSGGLGVGIVCGVGYAWVEGGCWRMWGGLGGLGVLEGYGMLGVGWEVGTVDTDSNKTGNYIFKMLNHNFKILSFPLNDDIYKRNTCFLSRNHSWKYSGECCSSWLLLFPFSSLFTQLSQLALSM